MVRNAFTTQPQDLFIIKIYHLLITKGEVGEISGLRKYTQGELPSPARGAGPEAQTTSSRSAHINEPTPVSPSSPLHPNHLHLLSDHWRSPISIVPATI